MADILFYAAISLIPLSILWIAVEYIGFMRDLQRLVDKLRKL